MTVLNLVIIGCGKAGLQHMIAAHGTKRFKIVGGIDNDPGQALPDIPFFASLAQAQSATPIDAVAVCTPPGTHYPLVMEALISGYAIMLEKPPFMNRREYERIRNAATASCLPVHVMLQHRLSPQAPIARTAPGRSMGALLVSRHRPDEWFTTGWHGDAELAHGGIISHLAIHYLDLAIRILGEPVSFISAPGTEAHKGIDRQVAGILSFSNSSQLAIAVTGCDLNRTETFFVATQEGILGMRDGLSLSPPIDLAAPTPSNLRQAAYDDFAAAVLQCSVSHPTDNHRLSLHRVGRLQTALDLIRSDLLSGRTT